MKFNDRRFFVVTVIVSLFLSATAIFHVSAQQSKCPTVSVTCPDTVYLGGDVLSFVVNVTGGDPNVTPTYNWTVSNGSIASGQGTVAIRLDLGEVTDNSTVTATVDVGGYDRECSTSSSCTASVLKRAEARKLDEYGKLAAKDENARLDNFAIELQNDPTAQGYVIAYGGRKSPAGEAKKMAASAKDYLVKKRNLDAQRVMSIDGGLREEPIIELWLVPSEATPPTASPTVNPGETKPPTRKKS
jgi:hypothetical protein